jgi:hypothetical protein
MKRTVIAVALATVIGIGTTVAGAASSGPRTEQVRYAPGSEYVYSSSGKKIGTLNGSGLNTQFLTVVGDRAR